MDVYLTKKAKKAIDSLPKKVRSRIEATIDKFLQFPKGVDAKKLHGIPGIYRVRIGDYRILVSLEDHKVVVVNVLPRSKAYKQIPKNPY